MTIVQSIWAHVYATEFHRLMSDWVTGSRPSTAAECPAAIAAAMGERAAAMADAAVERIPEATQAALAARILALKPA